MSDKDPNVKKFAKVLNPDGTAAYVYVYYNPKIMDMVVKDDSIKGEDWKRISYEEYSSIIDKLYSDA